VFDLFKRQIPLVLRTCRFVPESIVVDGDRAAMLSRQSSRRAADDRAICFRVTNFMRFRDGKVVENVLLIDSFDAVEQVIGRPLAAHERRTNEDDVVAV
jgi:ketosteroid isomerase-like protein